jgi:hypothetical protein
MLFVGAAPLTRRLYGAGLATLSGIACIYVAQSSHPLGCNEVNDGNYLKEAQIQSESTLSAKPARLSFLQALPGDVVLRKN